MTVGDIQAIETEEQKGGHGYSWFKSRTSCGLYFREADQGLSGSWKCHLADTSNSALEENIRFCS